MLLIDLDPQGNASTGLGVGREPTRGVTSYDLLLGETPASRRDRDRRAGPVVVPATADLSAADLEMGRRPAPHPRSCEALAPTRRRWRAGYDYVLIDCPPSLNLLTVNALVAAHSVLVPLQCEFFALEGLSQLMLTVRRCAQAPNPGLQIEGVVLTMFDRRNSLSGQVEADVRENLGDLVYETVIPRNVRLCEAPSHAKPVLIYDPPAAAACLSRLAGRAPGPRARLRHWRAWTSGELGMERKGLGRGLSALMADLAPTSQSTEAPRRAATPADRRVPIERIRPNPDQPRRALRRGGARDLAASIREKGVIQPLIVRPHPTSRATTRSSPASGAGARRSGRGCTRCRCSCATSTTARCSRSPSSRTSSAPTSTRSRRRAGYRQLIDRFGHTQEQVAEALGKSRSHVANLLRLLNLPEPVQDMVRGRPAERRPRPGADHRADPVALARQSPTRGLSVRETERLARAARRRPPRPGARGRPRRTPTPGRSRRT